MKHPAAIGALSSAVILALAVCALAALYAATDGFNEDIRTFTAALDGKPLPERMTLLKGEEIRVQAGYPLDLKDRNRSYNVQVLPNPEADFTYTVNDTKKHWKDAGDLTRNFEITWEKGGFLMKVPQIFSVNAIVRDLSGGAFAEDVREEGELFVLAVSSYNGKTVYRTVFAVREAEYA